MSDTARRTLDRYGRQSFVTRLHTSIRWRSCPFEAVAASVPTTGRVLEVGCGHGLLSTYLALESSSRTVVGTDVDGDKIEAAQRAAAGIANLAFEITPRGHFADGPWDAVCIVDVLYLIGRAGQRRTVETAAANLASGGVLVIKEMDASPLWKFRLMAIQEWLSVRVLRITEGHDLTFVPPEEVAQWMTEAGLATERRRLDRRSVHPHHLLVGRIP